MVEEKSAQAERGKEALALKQQRETSETLEQIERERARAEEERQARKIDHILFRRTTALWKSSLNHTPRLLTTSLMAKTMLWKEKFEQQQE